MMKNAALSNSILCLVGAVALFPVAAIADTPAWEFSTIGGQSTNGNWTFGEVFTANQNFSVDSLGYYDPSTGMTDTHAVGLFDSAGDLLASTTITSASDPLSAHFLYNAITPVNLIAGDTYVIEGVSGVDPYAYNDGGFTVSSQITIVGNNDFRNDGLTFLGTGLNDVVPDGYWGADFASSATPEPSSFLLLGSGLAGFAGMLRRKLTA